MKLLLRTYFATSRSLEPVSPCLQNNFLGTLVVDAGHFGQFIHRQFREVVAGLDVVTSQFGGQLLAHPLKIHQIIGDPFQLFLSRNRFRQQNISGTVTQFIDNAFVKTVNFQHLGERHIGHFFEAIR